MLAGVLLDAEAKMGHLLNDRTERGGSSNGKRGGASKPLPEGITHKQSSAFQTLAANEDIIEQVKADAEAEDDLPTRTEVLRRVKEKSTTKQSSPRKRALNQEGKAVANKRTIVWYA